MLDDIGPQRPSGRLVLRLIALRLMDVLLSLVALLILIVPMTMIAAIIRLQDGGPVLFAQKRIGWSGRSFRCLKFRTMKVDADRRLAEHLLVDTLARAEWARDQKLRRDPRVTPIGQLLRKLSLDELPQFVNVLLGEMSLVGPRPIVSIEAERYGARYDSYCLVRPGITGLWQVSGRNDVPYRRRVAMDAVFARHCSLRLYLLILAQTPSALIRRRGAY